MTEMRTGRAVQTRAMKQLRRDAANIGPRSSKTCGCDLPAAHIGHRCGKCGKIVDFKTLYADGYSDGLKESDFKDAYSDGYRDGFYDASQPTRSTAEAKLNDISGLVTVYEKGLTGAANTLVAIHAVLAS